MTQLLHDLIMLTGGVVILVYGGGWLLENVADPLERWLEARRNK